MTGSQDHYRPDIDGLRAIAVLLVIGFHFFPNQIPGGFIGVDIFFVISGYLITQIILREKDSNSFSLTGFYARRARRILPALVCVLVATWVIGRYTLLATEFVRLSRHIMAGAAFYANMQLWHESGYFDANSALKPLLHLWSLGVEEQFYLIWPLILLAFSRKNLLLVTVMLGVLSFGLNLFFAATHPVLDFYSILTRFWELLVGCGLAILLPQQSFFSRRLQGIFATFAIGLFIASSLLFNSLVPFPSWRALIPTFSAAILIGFTQHSTLNRLLLGQRRVVLLGKISYPLYLWHWPIISFLNTMQDSQPTMYLKVAGIVLSFCLAMATWLWVEIPTQKFVGNYFRSARSTVIVGASVLAALYALGLITVQMGGLPWRFPNKEPRDEYMGGTNCSEKYGITYPIKQAFCYSTNEHPKVAFIGDSHARSGFFGELAAHSPMAQSMIALGGSSCPFLTDVYADVNSVCADLLKRIHLILEHDLPDVSSVVLFLRGPRYLSNDSSFDESVSVTEWPLKTNVESLANAKKEELFKIGLSRTVEWLHNQGRDVTLFMAWPELNFKPETCFDSRPARILPIEIRRPCAISADTVRRRRDAYAKIIDEVQRQHPYLKVFDPFPYLCDEINCWAGKNLSWYTDTSHLNSKGYSNVTAGLQSFINANLATKAAH